MLVQISFVAKNHSIIMYIVKLTVMSAWKMKMGDMLVEVQIDKEFC
jgi:hypothetical protein